MTCDSKAVFIARVITLYDFCVLIFWSKVFRTFCAFIFPHLNLELLKYALLSPTLNQGMSSLSNHNLTVD